MVPILPPASIGILGSGQLGLMLALEARRMGYGVRVLSPDIDTPCGRVADAEIVAQYDDLDAVRAFAQSVSVVTYEFENVPSSTVAAIESVGVPVRPGANVLHIAQNRLREKAFFQSLGIAVPRFARVASEGDSTVAVRKTGLPAILKTAGSGYDGKGQRTVRTETETLAAWGDLGGVECILEAMVGFAWEGSVVAARSVSGDFAHYGLTRNDHAHHILNTATAPAFGTDAAQLAEEAVDATRRIMDALNVVGVLCVEFFITPTGDLVANEMAPRPHNSGHWTQNGARTNQFEQQLRAVCALPLGDTTPLAGGAATANLLGDLWTPGEPDFAAMLGAFPDVKLHLYGKREARPGRKMGHLNVTGATPDEARARVLAARDHLTKKTGDG